MLTSDTKQKIDKARNILVGRIPTPTGQVEQITLALIYKFMSDIDDQNVALGAKPKFFIGDYKKYNWSNLIDLKLSSAERVLLYGEGLEKMNLNPNLPVFFRNIFKGAFLPFRDPEVLKLFLNKINEFSYSHSEELGNAFEYLLSVMDSQGDAGQFRTPRHIIDFIVDCVEPQKSDRILDPACGTAGFLISAYKYIMQKNIVNGSSQPGSALSFKERSNITNNFEGYDISHDMVRLSMVNMFLHNFPEPKIHEYDTLGSLEKWNDDFDCILANPPFMSPSGGIRPHNRFSIQAKRSEVLFVDYICEHLLPSGKAGIIVPEGIIFQSGKAYKQLRKMLVENYLWAVVSLPAGVFNPYAGVKTSILLIDKQLNKASDNILFVKVENDGYDLGAQRRKIDKDDLPESKKILLLYKNSLKTNKAFSSDYDKLLLISKDKIAAKDDYNLSMERYRINDNLKQSKWDLVRLGDVGVYINGFPFKPDDWKSKGKKIIRIQNLTGSSKEYNFSDRNDIPEKYIVKNNDLLISWSATIGFFIWKDKEAFLNQHIFKVIPNPNILKLYLYYLGDKIREKILQDVHGNTMQHITKGKFDNILIPLPPLSVQEEIVNKIENYQSIINGAHQIVENYKPQIDINPEWEIVELGNVFKLSSGRGLTQQNMIKGDYPVYGGNGVNGYHCEYFLENPSIVIGRVGAYCGSIHITKPKSWVTDNGLYVVKYLFDINQKYLAMMLKSKNLNQFAKVGGQPSISQNTIYEVKISLPSLDEQQQIVFRLEQEQKLIDAAKELINLYEQKIKNEISKIWE